MIMTRAMAVDHGAQGIRVNCIVPGPLYTPMAVADGMTERKREGRRLSSVLEIEGTGWDVAHAAVYLASDEARYVTGVVLPVDGDARLRELAILRVGYVTRCAYEFSHHVRIGREFGLTTGDINLVRRPGDGPAPDAGAGVVIQAATEITTDLGLADETWQRLVGLLGTGGAVELVLVVAHYCAVVRVLNSLKVDVEPEYEQYLREFPLDDQP